MWSISIWSHLLLELLLLVVKDNTAKLMRKNEILGAHYLEHATTPHSCHGIFVDWFIFRSNFPYIRLPWECYDQSRETNLTPLRHWAETAFLSQKKRYSQNRSVCKNVVIWSWYGSCMLLLVCSWRYVAFWVMGRLRLRAAEVPI